MPPRVVGSPTHGLLFALSVCLTVIAAVLAFEISSAQAKLVYLSDGLYTANDDGSNPFQVTTDAHDMYPALSGDGRTIAFGNSNPDDPGVGDIYLIDADGQNERLLFDETSGLYSYSRPAFAPDKDQLVFVRSEGEQANNDNLYRIDLDGQNLTQLTNDPWYEYDPAFAPDGNLIAYSSSNNFFGMNQIMVMKADGSQKREVTPKSRFFYDITPSFSGDGKKLAFIRSPDGFGGDVYSVNVTGTGLTQLTHFGDTGDSFATDPTWSADGSTIVFNTWGDLCCQLWAMNADGSNQHKIVDLGFMPSFNQPNGMAIGGDLFLISDFELDPAGNYQVTIQATDRVDGVKRYELAVDGHDDRGYVVKDSVDFNCNPRCPRVGPTKTLILSAPFVPNDESELEARAYDGADNVAKASQTVRKEFRQGITEPRLGRTDDPQPPHDYPVFGDPRFDAIQPHYFRIFVPWERLEPAKDNYQWDADVGGSDPGNTRYYEASIPEQIKRMKMINPDVEFVIVFTQTPCWAIIPLADDANPTCTYEPGSRPEGGNVASWPDPNLEEGRDYTGVAQYKEFVQEFAKRYSDPESPSYEPAIRFYIPWNEPNHFGQSQPQKCEQEKPGDLDFKDIPCPPGNVTGEITSDDYYLDLYNSTYDAINRDPIPGKEPQKFPTQIQVLGGETADNRVLEPDRRFSVDEAAFTAPVIREINRRTSRRCGAGSDGAPWTKHAYKDLRFHAYAQVQRVRRLLDGQNPQTGAQIFDTSGCTKDKQIWVTELAGWYGEPPPEHPEDPDFDAQAPCELHDFLDAREIAPEDPPGSGIHPDARRVDVYMQYLFQTDVETDDPTDPQPPGFDSGLLYWQDVEGNDDLLDQRLTYDVFYDWSLFSHKIEPRPTRSDYEGEPFNCDWDSLGGPR